MKRPFHGPEHFRPPLAIYIFYSDIFLCSVRSSLGMIERELISRHHMPTVPILVCLHYIFFSNGTSRKKMTTENMSKSKLRAKKLF